MNAPRSIGLGFAVVFLGMAPLFPTNAQAGCYEILGCTDEDHFTDFALIPLSCENLGYLRNSIFAENGYCFEQPKYERQFGNRDCRFKHSDEVPLNETERANVDAILEVEKQKGCRIE
jgi:hypothetical protein